MCMDSRHSKSIYENDGINQMMDRMQVSIAVLNARIKGTHDRCFDVEASNSRIDSCMSGGSNDLRPSTFTRTSYRCRSSLERWYDVGRSTESVTY